MYTALKHSHMLFAVLTLLLSIAYVALAWKPTPANKSTLVYVFTRIVGGIAALTGLGVTFAGPWTEAKLMFPYIGLILYAVHGICIGFAKRSAQPGQITLRRVLLVLQLVALIALSWLMRAKPF